MKELGKYSFHLQITQLKWPFFRLKGPDFGLNSEEMETDEREIRVVLTAPHKDLTLEEEDIAFMLVQYVNESDVSESKGI